MLDLPDPQLPDRPRSPAEASPVVEVAAMWVRDRPLVGRVPGAPLTRERPNKKETDMADHETDAEYFKRLQSKAVREAGAAIAGGRPKSAKLSLEAATAYGKKVKDSKKR